MKLSNIKTIILLCTIVLLNACATNIKSLKIDKSVVLGEQEGYLFLGIRTSSSLDKLLITGRKRIAFTSSDLRRGSNYLLVNLPAGKYEISMIQVGRLKWNISNKDLWSFEVKPKIVSYVGDLEVQRNWLYARFELVNNSSRALEFLEEKFNHLISEIKIQYWGPGDDSFFEEVRPRKSKEAL